MGNRFRKVVRSRVEVLGTSGLKYKFGGDAVPKLLLETRPERVVDANFEIAAAIDSDRAHCTARLGNDEFETLEKWRRRRRGDVFRNALEVLALGDPFFSFVRSRFRAEKAGLRPLSPQALQSFFDIFTESLPEVDLLASWIRGENFYTEYVQAAKLTTLPGIEPYRSSKPWSEALESKKVLVVHPFDETIRRQYTQKREKLFPGTAVLPRFDLLTYRPPRSHFNEIRGVGHWFELLDRMVGETSALNFDVAIIGAGPFGLPLAGALKRRGKVVIQLGGPTQLLFGIMGKRWEFDAKISTLRNEFWVYPAANETPSWSQRRRSPYWG